MHVVQSCTTCEFLLFECILLNYFNIRLPRDTSMNRKWKDIIKDANGGRFCGKGYVCELHFEPNLIKRSKTRITLNENALPSIFLVECLMEVENEYESDHA